ncbi:MAG: UDP-N-acetylmuramate dehydrogenase [Prevotellaceae bacterium]|jgi:UDP-N-acetylmuramate dehydrogenase|nr:UDP-N-acetylmuramate dehydrogenase [Prevotellaceae bacterium]
MIEIKTEKEENKSLKAFNSFGFEAKARYFAAPDSENKIMSLLDDARKHDIPVFVLGGGNNVVFTKDFDGLVLCPKIESISIISEDSVDILLDIGAGVVWDDFVHYTSYVNFNGISGVENLAGIPGTVGAAPVQNIGAYGMEVKDAIFTVRGIYIDDNKTFLLKKSDCQFAYRDSIFKNSLKQKTVITCVTFKLSKKHEYKLDYGNLKDELAKYDKINLRNIRQAVLDIRAAKLPDPKKLGNAGSFFKNPVVERSEVERLMEQFPLMPTYPVDNPDASRDKVKLSAAWMIENCALKGYRQNNIGVHHKQALVLVNYGGGTAQELIDFSQMVQDRVFDKFGVKIEPEVVLN